jgi:conjugative transposon TraN protein
MKSFLLLFLAILLAPALRAQDNLPIVNLPVNMTIHFVSPEPIRYVDISSKGMVGDLPLANVLRLKLRDSSVNFQDAVVTIVGERFMAQYHVVPGGAGVPTEIEIVPSDTRPLDIFGNGFSVRELQALAQRIFASKPKHALRKSSAFGIKARLNQVYTAGDYLFLDVGYRNKTNLMYDIEDIRFSIVDQKVTKASNVQSLELKPELVLFDQHAFEHGYRNIFVFRKLSFPGNKILSVELSEKQVSGRVINLSISYKNILRADIISD